MVGKAQCFLPAPAAAGGRAERTDEGIPRRCRINGRDVLGAWTVIDAGVIAERRTGGAERDQDVLYTSIAQHFGRRFDILPVDVFPISADWNAGQVRRLMLVGRKIGQAAQQFFGKRRGRRRVEHHLHALFMGKFRDQLVDLHRDLQLENDQIIFRDPIAQEFDVLLCNGHIGAGQDEDTVLCGAVRLLFQNDHRAAGGLGFVEEHMLRMYPGRLAGREDLLRIAVAAQFAQHGHVRAEQRRLNGLIFPLTAWCAAEFFTQHGLSLAREDRRGCGLIHRKAADYKNSWFLHIRFSPGIS